ncbi:hypothetical protein UPYG_G00054800 [Umbra pygmaea]|uniref:Uncharacterized protein n=1 Tax=Umbra pygmaea TaxID=75934 RepID=A0ABD0X7Z3_UMBPY
MLSQYTWVVLPKKWHQSNIFAHIKPSLLRSASIRAILSRSLVTSTDSSSGVRRQRWFKFGQKSRGAFESSPLSHRPLTVRAQEPPTPRPPLRGHHTSSGQT